MADEIQTTGGQTNVGTGASELVTPSGEVVGSADPGEFGSSAPRRAGEDLSSSRRQELIEQQRAIEQARFEAEQARREIERQARGARTRATDLLTGVRRLPSESLDSFRARREAIIRASEAQQQQSLERQIDPRFVTLQSPELQSTNVLEQFRADPAVIEQIRRRQFLQTPAGKFIDFITGGEPGRRPLGLDERFFTSGKQDPTSLPARVRTTFVGGVSGAAQQLGLSPGISQALGEAALSVALLTPLSVGTVAQQALRRKSFTEIAKEQLKGLKGRFDDIKATTATSVRGQILRSDMKNRIRRAILELKDPADIQKLRQLLKQSGGREAEKLLDDVIAEGVQVFRPVRPGQVDQPASLPGVTVPPKVEERELPASLGGTARSRPEESSFFATGQFERTDLVAAPVPRGAARQIQTGFESQTIGSATSFIQPEKSRIEQFINTAAQQLQQRAQLEQLAQSQPLIERQRQQQRQRQLSLQKPRTSPALAQQPQLRFPSPPRIRPPTRPPRIPTRTLVPPPPSVPEPDIQAIKRTLKKMKGKGAFDVFVKKKGKFVKVADDLPINRALKKATTEVKATLSAQLKIVPDPKKKPKLKDIKSFTPDPGVFRDFKIVKGKAVKLPPGQLIERRNKRISSSGEIKDIIKAQKQSNKKRARKRRIKIL